MRFLDTDYGTVSNEEPERSPAGCSSGPSTRAASAAPALSINRCHLCGEAAASAHGLSLHLRRVHDVISCTSSQLNPTQHTCKQCGKSLSSASSLDRHMLVHSGERPFKCKRHMPMAELELAIPTVDSLPVNDFTVHNSRILGNF